MATVDQQTFSDYAQAAGIDVATLAEQVGRTSAAEAPKFGPPPPPAKNGGLQGDELALLQRSMGTLKSSAPRVPHTNSRGDFVLPTLTPSEHREMAAAKDGK